MRWWVVFACGNSMVGEALYFGMPPELMLGLVVTVAGLGLLGMTALFVAFLGGLTAWFRSA